MSKNRIFISYSHRGNGPEWKAALLRALHVFERHHLLDVWQDGKIRVSSSWDDDIKQAMSNARLAVVLLTKEALESEYIRDVEFPFLCERRQRDKLPVFPVICEACDWRVHEWLRTTQAPNQSNPLSQISTAAQDRIFHKLATDIAEEISRVTLADLAARPPVGSEMTEVKVESGTETYLDKFPLTRTTGQREEKLIGRKQEIALLDLALAQPHTAIVSLVAWGGVGKTMLVQHWLQRLQREGWFGARRVYAWSFYSQGIKEDRQASEDTFLAHALEWFGVQCEPTLSPWDKGHLLADAITSERTLLALDGLEPLQYPPGPMGGQLRAPGVQSLLKQLARKANATEHRGLCLVTTREPLTDLAEFERRPDAAWGGMLRIYLGNLIEEAGAALLHHAGATRAGAAEIKPDDAELLAASREVDGHALTLNLLGRFLAHAHGGDVRRRDLVKFEEADRKEQGGTTFKMLAAFEDWFARSGEFGARQLAVLRMLGLFDRPADAGCISALRKPPAIAGLTNPLFHLRGGFLGWGRPYQPLPEEDWNTATSFLADFGLLVIQPDTDNREHVLDCHPLIREHFAKQSEENNSEAWRNAHGRLHKYLEDSTKEWMPDTLDGLRPLYDSVVHGCKAGLHSSAKYVFCIRIRRGPYKAHSILRLGAFGDDLKALASFFTIPWSEFPKTVKGLDQGWILNEAAFCLRSVGRLSEAIDPMRDSFKMNCDWGHLDDASIVAGNLGELLLLMGDVESAVVEERLSVEFAERSSAIHSLIAYQTALADALHQSGQHSEAMARFDRAVPEGLAAEIPQLFAQGNFRHCELLLQKAECAAWRVCLASGLNNWMQGQEIIELERCCSEVQDRAHFSSDYAKRTQLSSLGSALDELVLGRSALYRSLIVPSGENVVGLRLEARQHLDAAVDALRRVGQVDQVPRALLTRAWILYLENSTQALADAHSDLDEAWQISERGPMRLHMADVHLHRARLFRDRVELKKARLLIEQCGYWRRRQELEDCERKAASW